MTPHNETKTILCLYTTFPDEKSAKKCAQKLLHHQAVACVTFHQVSSMYAWIGEIEVSPEWVLLCKTSCEHEIAARELIVQDHPYKIPCILSWPVQSSPEYAQWVIDSTLLSDNK